MLPRARDAAAASSLAHRDFAMPASLTDARTSAQTLAVVALSVIVCVAVAVLPTASLAVYVISVVPCA